jgi:hypothetical protein
MAKRFLAPAGILLAGGLSLMAPSAHAQVGGGTWVPQNPGFKVQEEGCGTVKGLIFTLTCSATSGKDRAERRYETHGSGIWQFEGLFKILSLGGSRISLKQTFKDDPGAGPYFLLAVERGGRLYAVHGGDTIATGATVGTTVRVNTIHEVGNVHRTYINGQLRHTVTSPSGNFYDKLGFYRTASGQGPGSVQWSSIKFWRR